MRITLLGLISYLRVASMGCKQPTSPPRVAVTGRVSLDGKPLESGTIRFVSDRRSGDVTTMIERGQFHLDQAVGPTAGTYDVIVTPLFPELPAAKAAIQAGERDPFNLRQVPQRYQRLGLLKATIDPLQNDQLHFELTSR